MSDPVQNILSQIDRLDDSERDELRAALGIRSRARWEREAELERKRSAVEGISQADIDRAVDQVRYGEQNS